MFRVSLREMFLLVAATALAIVSLIYASPAWQTIVGVAVVLSAMIALITGMVDRGSQRAFPIGFAVAALGYLLVVIHAPTFMRGPSSQLGNASANAELDVYEGRLPTSMLLGYLYAGIKRTTYFDSKTNEQIPASESANLSLIAEDKFGDEGTGGGTFGNLPVSLPAGQRAAYYQMRPPTENFMAIGQFWWALLFGYVGGHFAKLICKRRNTEQPSTQ